MAKLITFFVGTTRYDTGKRINIYRLDDWELNLIQEFGGFSRSQVTGAWENDGTVIREESLKYEIAANDVDLKRVSNTAKDWAGYLDQFVIGVTVQDLALAEFGD